MKFEIPKHNLREEKDERIEDVEQAHFMALIENVKLEESRVYADYLRHPDAYGGFKYSHFRQLEEEGIRPEDLKEIGRSEAELQGEFYEHRKKIENLQREGKKWEIFKLAAKEGFKFVGQMYACSFEAWKDIFELATSPEKRRNFKNRIKEEIGIEVVDPKEARERNLKNYKKNEGVYGRLLKNATNFIDSAGALFSKSGEEMKTDKVTNILSDIFREQAEDYHRISAEKEATDDAEKGSSPEENSNIGEKFTECIFNVEANFYDEFLKDKGILGGLIKKHFESLKEKGISPEEIRKDGKYWKGVVSDLKVWNEKLKMADDLELDIEIKENLRRFRIVMLGFKKYRKGEENRYVQDYVVSMYKFFRACYMKAKKKEETGHGANKEALFNAA